jgi:SAM-dependent methyltransferase
MDQGEMFLKSEGDHYFARNKSAIEHFDPETDFPLRLIDSYQLRPSSVLEVGSSSGFRLAELHRRHGCRVVGVDPSLSAIEHGRTCYPAIEFHQGVASAIPVQEEFELVIVNYVLHWVDRARLLASVAEIDRVVRDGGFLLLGDFYPDHLSKVRYHHLPDKGVFTYKQDYASLFVASGLYHLVGSLSIRYPDRLTPCSEENSRAGFWLLQKSLTGRYVEKHLAGLRA